MLGVLWQACGQGAIECAVPPAQEVSGGADALKLPRPLPPFKPATPHPTFPQKVSGGADLFVGFGGVVRRPAVEAGADWWGPGGGRLGVGRALEGEGWGGGGLEVSGGRLARVIVPGGVAPGGFRPPLFPTPWGFPQPLALGAAPRLCYHAVAGVWNLRMYGDYRCVVAHAR